MKCQQKDKKKKKTPVHNNQMKAYTQNQAKQTKWNQQHMDLLYMRSILES